MTARRGYPLRIAPGMPFWDRFVDEMDARGRELHTGMDEVEACYRAIDDELEKFGVTTDWEDELDPLWFPSREERARFLLTWG